MSRLGEKLIAALNEGIAIARGEADPATYRVHMPIGVPSATGSRCPHPTDCDEDGCTGHCADVRRYGLVTDDMPPRRFHELGVNAVAVVRLIDC